LCLLRVSNYSWYLEVILPLSQIVLNFPATISITWREVGSFCSSQQCHMTPDSSVSYLHIPSQGVIGDLVTCTITSLSK